jgi:DNA-binding beta-propeller fold protein YncE
MKRLFVTTPLVAGVAFFLLGAEPRLISSEPLSGPDGAFCAWDDLPAPANIDAFRAYEASRIRAAYPAAPGLLAADTCAADGCDDVAARKPLRFIQDPYAGFSAIRVDPVRNEVVLMDEFKFHVYVYDRTAVTPPSAARTEPKRFIGGSKTHSQFNSDTYVDPGNGDIYVVNNDSVPGMNVFSRQSRGNVAPDRELLTPYGSFGITADEERQELFLTIQHDGAIQTFRKTAKGREEHAIRLIQGNRTRMADPHGIAFDPKGRLLYVANYGAARDTLMSSLGSGATIEPRRPNWPAGNTLPFSYRHEVVYGTGRFGPPSITVYPADAIGNTAPVREIVGPKAQLDWPTGVSIDAERGEIYVANAAGDSITVFSTTAQGNVAPLRVIKGPRTLLKSPNGVSVDTVSGEVWVANFGNHTATAYKSTASGDVAPLRVIRSAPLDAPTTLISNPYMIAYDSNRSEILVPNCVAQPRIATYAMKADGNATPNRIIEGQKTLLNRTVHAIDYDPLHDEIIVQSNIGQAIVTYRGAATGDEAPIRLIQGPRTRLRDPQTIFVDPVHDEIFVMNMSIEDEMLVFDRKAQGDVPPKRILKGPDTKLGAVVGAVDPVANLLFTSGRSGGILIFDRTAEGNAKPLRMIGGPKSGILRGASRIVVHPATRKIVVTTGGAGPESDELTAYAAVFSMDDSGDVAPQWTIAKGFLKEVRGLTLDAKSKNVIVSDKALNAVLTFALPEMFDVSRSRQTAQAVRAARATQAN